MMKKNRFSPLPVLAVLLFACASTKQDPAIRPVVTPFSKEIKQEIQKIERSIVGLGTIVKYDIYKYDLEGKISSIEKDEKTLTGGGLIIKHDRAHDKYIILTSSHIVAPKDTIDIYYLNESGRATTKLFSRGIIRQVIVTVRGNSNWRSEASLLAVDPASDLATIVVKTDNLLGQEFENTIGYEMDLSWGDWVYLFGYPKGIKQMTGGWVSPSPYPGTHAVDAVVRSGFSGGPVFTLADDSRLAFVGLIKSVPRSTLEYIAPDETMPIGFQLSQKQLQNLVVKKQLMVDYGTAYFVNAQAIKKFFNQNRFDIELPVTRISEKYFR